MIDNKEILKVGQNGLDNNITNQTLFEIYKYLVIFHSNDFKMDYEPIIKTTLGEKPYINQDTTHLLDSDLVSIFPAVEFILQLPRASIDLYNLPEDVIDKSFDSAHDILIIPDIVFERMVKNDNLTKFGATIVFYDEQCDNLFNRIDVNVKNKIPFYSTESLDDKALNDVYLYLSNREVSKTDVHKYYQLMKTQKRFLLRDDKIKMCSAFFLETQYGKLQELYQRIFQENDMEKLAPDVIFNRKLHNDVLCKLLQRPNLDNIKQNADIYEKEYSKEREKMFLKELFNVVITAPGISKQQVKKAGLTYILPQKERMALRLMGVHRAVAENAILVEMPILSKEYYDCLEELERTCKDGTNNAFVWRKLRDLGKIFNDLLSEKQRKIISRAKHISVFSDAPIGLGIVPGMQIPLHFLKEISYHPITPMGRTFAMEMMKKSSVYYKHRFKLIYAECIPDNDQNKAILACSRGIIQKLRDYTKEYPNFTFDNKNTMSVNELKKYIAENNDASAIIISAHGYYNKESNMSGIMVGTEFWMADDMTSVPPLVMLSSCYTAPRGSGCVSVADMFLRSGAIAVLAASVPLNAHRNSILFIRLIVYILEAQRGSKQYKNMLELWTGVTCVNAVHEIMQESNGMQQWLYGRNSKGILRLQDFELNRANKAGIRTAFIYSDTIKILNKMLEEEGMQGKYDAIFNTENYFPECFFYQFLGNPENIMIYNEVFEDI